MDEKNAYREPAAGEPVSISLDRSRRLSAEEAQSKHENNETTSRLWLFRNYCLTLFYAMPFSLRLLLAAALLGLSLLPSVLPFSPGFPYGKTRVRGVNLGGWLVLEVCTQYPFRLV
jgi:hypothetical protein